VPQACRRWSPRTDGVLRCGRRQRAGGLGEEEPAVTSLATHRMCAWQGEEVAKLTGQHGDGGGGGEEMWWRGYVRSQSGRGLRWKATTGEGH
jgi:hypothetical protein